MVVRQQKTIKELKTQLDDLESLAYRQVCLVILLVLIKLKKSNFWEIKFFIDSLKKCFAIVLLLNIIYSTIVFQAYAVSPRRFFRAFLIDNKMK